MIKDRHVDKLSVAVVAFDGMSPFHLSAPSVVFGERHPDCPSIDFDVCAVKPGTLRTSAGFDIVVRSGLSVLKRADIIIVPSWSDLTEPPSARLLQALRQAHARGAQIVGLCLGAYIIAQTGLLNDRSATTHWANARDFAQRYPKIKFDPDVLYVEDHGIVTSAGTAAGIDCCLYLLRQRYGSVVANRVARRLVVPPYRQGRQAQFIEHPVPQTKAHSRLSDALDWLRENLHVPHTLDSLATRAMMSRRTLTRQIKQLTGTHFLAWLHTERVVYAQRLLESTEASIEAIADNAGFGSVESLRLHFRRQVGVSPSEWRKQFRH